MTMELHSAISFDGGARSAAQSAEAARPRSGTDQLAALRDELRQHPLWTCRLLRTCEQGHLTKDDFAFVFSQYYLYSRNFTRYLAALMTTCESDLLRAKLSQNLWEEGGALEPEQRHAEIFRNFLRNGVGLDLHGIRYEGFTQHYVSRYLAYCRDASPSSASAFLALGTEGIVARLYGILVSGLEKAGVPREALKFFYLHMECDDEHAATLEEMTLTYANEAGWAESVRRGALAALDLRLEFFDELYRELERRRVQTHLEAIHARASLCGKSPARCDVVFERGTAGTALYESTIEHLKIDFAVERVPFVSEVLDPRLVRIKPGRRNENHRHAHETVFVIVNGTGVVRVNEAVHEVSAGDIVFVPRWAMHQTENLGDTEMLVVAVTDYHLTGRALIGNYGGRRPQAMGRKAES